MPIVRSINPGGYQKQISIIVDVKLSKSMQKIKHQLEFMQNPFLANLKLTIHYTK
jgi:hypothetical protein